MKKLLLVLLLGTIGAAQAAPAYYTNQATFNAAAGTLGALDLSSPAQPGPTLNFPGLTVTSTTWYGTNANELYYVGSGYVGSGVQGYNGITFSFGSAISAFGGSIVDLGTMGQTDFSVKLSRSGSVLDTNLLYDDFTSNFGDTLFLGIVDSSGFDTLEFIATNSTDYVEIRNISTAPANNVPEPASLALLGLGLAGLAAGRRRGRGRKD